MGVFADRSDAGRRLADKLAHLRGQDVVVLALPRGGVPVGLEVARALGAPLDVVLVRKLGVPYQPELAMGAIGEDGVRVENEEVIRRAGVDPEEIAEVERSERAELERRARLLRAGRPRVPLDGRTAVIVDDGIATGSTALAACRIARAHGAARVVVAVPVAPDGWEEVFSRVADEALCVLSPRSFWAIGQFYEDFRQLSDAEVVRCLLEAERSAGGGGAGGGGAGGGAYPPGSHGHARIQSAMESPPLFASFLRYLVDRGYPLEPSYLERDLRTEAGFPRSTLFKPLFPDLWILRSLL